MSSGFISEAEIAANKQKRQEEWEKVRQPDQPLGLLLYSMHTNAHNNARTRTRLNMRNV